ncbi:MAG: hypothetical protein JST54_01670 [Deltaproteobacteria bacterium]|nr:hypothetical protein [Deltaproteobacteria bacterium]
MTALLALALCAAPVLQPDPGGFKRLQPRQMDASSFLSNGWNKFEQNYLPLYAADDDPATAWVEGVAGPGEGEALSWYGPALKKARAFKVFIRSGYQKSQALFEANARPRKIRLDPLVRTEGAVGPGGRPVEVELQNVLGWQKVELPVPASVEGVRLTVISAYAGTKYDDLCISDVQVYVDGDDTYNAAVEARAAEQIRAFVADRKAAAAAGQSKSAVQLAPRYTEAQDGKFAIAPGTSGAKALSGVEAPAALRDVMQRALAATTAWEKGRDKSLRQHAVRISTTVTGLGSRRAALASAARADKAFASSLGYLATKDLALFEPSSKDDVADAANVISDLVGAGTQIPDCVARCEAALKPLLHREQVMSCFEVSDAQGNLMPGNCQAVCNDAVEQPCMAERMMRSETRGLWVQGSLQAPSSIYRLVSVTVGERDSVNTTAEELIAYTDGTARSIITSDLKTVSNDVENDVTTGAVRIYLLDWKAEPDHLTLQRVWRVTVGEKTVRVAHFERA